MQNTLFEDIVKLFESPHRGGCQPQIVDNILGNRLDNVIHCPFLFQMLQIGFQYIEPLILMQPPENVLHDPGLPRLPGRPDGDIVSVFGRIFSPYLGFS